MADQRLKTPYDSTNEPAQWTRIDMLLALYDGAIEQVQLAIDAVESGQLSQGAVHRTRAGALVTAIRTGIDTSQGELPVSIDQLAEFVQFSLAEGEAKKMKSGLKVLNELREGFRGIREDAKNAEANGEIPSLSDSAGVEVTC